MVLEKYIPDTQKGDLHAALCEMMRGFDVGKSYADMIRFRLSGAAADECNDTYYVAREDTKAISRHWNGWGRHPDAIGNWGNFYTNAEYRGRGIGGAVLKLWFEDFQSRTELPLCFLCSTSTKELTALYSRFGFRVAIEGTEYGGLYLPVGNSPATFREFYRAYYKPSDVLEHRRACIGYRHEIDCLLRFALRDLGLPFGIGNIESVEAALLYQPERCGMLFTPDGHCVGWSFDGVKQVYPLYEGAVVEEKSGYVHLPVMTPQVNKDCAREKNA